MADWADAAVRLIREMRDENLVRFNQMAVRLEVLNRRLAKLEAEQALLLQEYLARRALR
jgi:hypothetical protein